MGFGFGRLSDFDGNLLDAEYVLGEAGNFVRMKHQWCVFVVTDLGVEAFGVERWVEFVGVCVGVAIDRSPGTVENFLDRFDGDQLPGRVDGNAV